MFNSVLFYLFFLFDSFRFVSIKIRMYKLCKPKQNDVSA